MLLNLSANLFAPEQNFQPFREDKIYDTIIIGGGPAGLTAAVYCMRKGLATGLLAGDIGGQVAETAGIENYLGYRYINGMELVDKFREQVLQFGIDFEPKSQAAAIAAAGPDGGEHEVTMADGRRFRARTLIIATGKQFKKLGLPGEEALTGHGVAYCAICDAPLYAGRNVVVIGGGNSGVSAALDLARMAASVTLVQRRDRLVGDKILVDKLAAFTHVRYLLLHTITALHGENRLSAVTVRDLRDGTEQVIATDGLFVEVGLRPNSELARLAVAQNERGEIRVDGHCRTNVPGIFAAGDVTDVPYKQIIIACGEGAKAALAATDYLQNQPQPPR
jgi:NADH-dependent peroxiredoxin subunit F